MVRSLAVFAIPFSEMRGRHRSSQPRSDRPEQPGEAPAAGVRNALNFLVADPRIGLSPPRRPPSWRQGGQPDHRVRLGIRTGHINQKKLRLPLPAPRVVTALPDHANALDRPSGRMHCRQSLIQRSLQSSAVEEGTRTTGGTTTVLAYSATVACGIEDLPVPVSPVTRTTGPVRVSTCTPRRAYRLASNRSDIVLSASSRVVSAFPESTSRE